jgi:TPR repeat protein
VAIRVAPTTQAEAASNARLVIQLVPREAIAANSFVRIRGLPPTAALTEGHVIAPGSWAVPLAALPNLTIVLPTGLQGQSDIAISLVSVDGTILAEARTVLVVAAPPARPSAREVPSSPPAVAGVARTLPPADRERTLALHAKGQEQLERGNIYAARKFFERAAEIGLAQSAVALAGTYDPDELAQRKVVGIQPDAEAAKKWYEKARELGAAEASDRLRRLGSR